MIRDKYLKKAKLTNEIHSIAIFFMRESETEGGGERSDFNLTPFDDTELYV